MNTTSTTSRLAAAATIAALALTAAACGTETGATPDPAGQEAPRQASVPSLRSPDAIERAAQARAEHADALRWARGHRTPGHTTVPQRAVHDRAAEAERAARAERADALRWAHGH
jgi:hypothetical protein